MNEEQKIPNNTEIDEALALKQFEAESQAGQTQKSTEALKAFSVPEREVEGIKFETPSYGAMKYHKEKDTPKMVKAVMRLFGGTIKDQKQAEYVLLGFVVVAIILAIFFFSHSNIKPVSSAISPQQITTKQQFLPSNIK
jgi:hypothetical protein